MPLPDATLDHVAIAVADVDDALTWWHQLGAVTVGGGEQGFRSEQVRTGSGAKVEMIGPVPGRPGFMDTYLERFGPGRIHHVTIKVGCSIHEADALLREEGLETVDLSDALPYWHETFVRPSVVGGLIAQVAWSDGSDAEWAERDGRPAPAPADPSSPGVTAVQLSHDDLPAAEAIWTTLGATIDGDLTTGGFVASWPRSPLRIQVVPGEHRGPVGLVVDGAEPAPRGAVAPAFLPA